MKIAQISSVYLSIPPKTHGGTERIVYHLCRQLSRRGHQVELFSSGDSRVDCPLHSVLPIACQDDPNSTIYLEKEFETRYDPRERDPLSRNLSFPIKGRQSDCSTLSIFMV